MTAHQIPEPPDAIPVLSRGKHRNPRKGGCFMELASFLAGERWSDHPACTHPLLAALARHVNDLASDAGRRRLAPLIPSVIGLTSDDPRVDARLALRAATTALPVVSEERQRVLALSVLAAEDLLAALDGRDGRRDGRLEPASREALDAVPGAEQWARDFRAKVAAERRPISVKAFRRHAAPHAVRCAAEGLADACVPDSEGLLYELLVASIDECRRVVGAAPAPAAPDEQWRAACRLVGAARATTS